MVCRIFASTHSFSQLVTSFFGSWCLGIHLMLFVAYPLFLVLSLLTKFSQCLTLPLFCYFGFIVILVISLISFEYSSLPFLFSIYFSMCYLDLFGSMVGSNGIEPSTSRLSGVRSNHLSYEPIFLEFYVVFLLVSHTLIINVLFYKVH